LGCEASLQCECADVVDADAELIQCVFVVSLHYFASEKRPLVPQFYDLHFELKWTHVEQLDDLQVSSVDSLTNVDECDFLFNFDFLVLNFGRYVLFLEEVSHLNVNGGRSSRYLNIDIGDVPIVPVGCEDVGVNEFGHFAEVAVCKDAPVHLAEVFCKFVETLDVLVTDFLIQILHNTSLHIPLFLA